MSGSELVLLDVQLPFPAPMFHKLLAGAGRDMLKPQRWRLSEMTRLSPDRNFTTIMGIPVYYATDTKPYALILETNQGDRIEYVNFGKD